MTQATPPATPTLDDVLRPMRVIIALLAVMLVGVTVAGVVTVASLRANDRAIINTRTESRRVQCLRDNQIRVDAGEAGAQKARDFIASQHAYTGAGPSTGRLKQAEDDYIASQKRVTLGAYPHRDCSKAGIDAFYKNPPPADPEPCTPNGKGICVTPTTTARP